MIETCTPEQQRAIEEKIELLKNLTEEKRMADHKKWRDELNRVRKVKNQKRFGWLEENFEELYKRLKKYRTPVEKAFRLVFFEYMKIDPKHIKYKFIPNREKAKAVFIRSRNFCPYEKAFEKLGIETYYYCKLFLEEPVAEMANKFFIKDGEKQGVEFGRNYCDSRRSILFNTTTAGIRPYIDECREFFIDEGLKYSWNPIHQIKYEAYMRMLRSDMTISKREAMKYVMGRIKDGLPVNHHLWF